MNGKRAKRLRRIAQDVTVEQAEKAYGRKEHRSVPGANISRLPIVLMPNCTRAAYRGIKRAAKDSKDFDEFRAVLRYYERTYHMTPPKP